MVATIADNSVVLYVNGNKVTQSKDWAKPGIADIAQYLVVGKNVFAAQAINGSAQRLPSRTRKIRRRSGCSRVFAICRRIRLWMWERIGAGDARRSPRRGGRRWSLTIRCGRAAELHGTPDYQLLANLTKAKKPYRLQHVRSCWANNDALMTALGRPNREQVVTYRPTAATTLQALELTNGPELTEIVHEGAKHWMAMEYPNDHDRIVAIYRAAPRRTPTEKEAADAMAAHESHRQLRRLQSRP